eukprot:scaffold82739_cov50-Phaeocystis_antarctica.AAC.1
MKPTHSSHHAGPHGRGAPSPAACLIPEPRHQEAGPQLTGGGGGGPSGGGGGGAGASPGTACPPGHRATKKMHSYSI